MKNKKNYSKTKIIIQSIVLTLLIAVLGCTIIAGFMLLSGENPLEKIQSVMNNRAIVDTTEVTSDVSQTTLSDGDSDEDIITEPTSLQDSDKEESTKTTTEESTTVKDIEDEPVTKIPVKVKGIYVTGPIAGSQNSMKELIELVNNTQLNAMVIDIKNDAGEITYKMDIDCVKETNAAIRYITDINALMETLKDNGIYTIARIVTFKDPILAEKKPEFSVKNQDGSIWRDKSKMAWVNPYNHGVWEYVIDIAKEAVAIGFDEIQFDYIRFSTDSTIKDADFGDLADEKSKTQIITEFTKYAYEELSPLGVFVSADVYGIIIDSKIDADNVGQNYVEMSKYLDSICPMIYPSHYGNGNYGIPVPDLEPYTTILKALNSSKKVLEEVDNDIVVRPWLQDFTAIWLKEYKKYTQKEIREQIQAVYDAGYEEWIFWNGSNRYTKDGFEMDDSE